MLGISASLLASYYLSLMCNKCSFSFIPRSKVALSTNAWSSECPSTAPAASTAENILNENNCEILVKIGEYSGVNTLLALASTNTALYRAIHGVASEKFWRIMCESVGSSDGYEYSFLFNYSDDIYYVMPNVVCPDSYREFYFSCLNKIKWLDHIKRNINLSFVQYLESYRGSHNRNFGVLRLFSKISPVYIVYSGASAATTLSYSDIEAFISDNNSSRIEESSSNGLTLHIHSDGLGAVKVAALHQSTDSDITFADVGYAVCLLSDHRIQAFKPHPITIEMPYEVYYIN